jgi:hypothetical protein
MLPLFFISYYARSKLNILNFDHYFLKKIRVVNNMWTMYYKRISYIEFKSINLMLLTYKLFKLVLKIKIFDLE